MPPYGSTRRSLTRVIAASMCMIGVGARVVVAQAKTQHPPGAVAGTIIDPNGQPIRDVEIAVVKTEISTRSDSVGKFILAGIEAGDHELRVRRLAYAPAVVNVEVESEDTVSVTITLSVVAQRLDAVLIHGDVARARIMREFEDRRRRGFGHFITRREIEERHPLLLSDMVRRVPGAVLTPGGAGRSVLRFSRSTMSSGRDCPPQYFVDGVMVHGFNIDDIGPHDIEGVELYAGPSVIPPQFNNSRSTVACGLVVIWTRVPGN